MRPWSPRSAAFPRIASSRGAKGEAWWSEIVGPGLALDTLRFRVLGIDYSAARATARPRTACSKFPPVSAYDQAEPPWPRSSGIWD